MACVRFVTGPRIVIVESQTGLVGGRWAVTDQCFPLRIGVAARTARPVCTGGKSKTVMAGSFQSFRAG